MARAVPVRAFLAASVLIVIACSTTDPTSPSTESPGAPPSIAATAAAPTDEPSNPVEPTLPPSPTAPSDSPDPAAPPAVELIVEGQPYAGTIGGYTWGTYSQSAPWRPATGLQPITVGAETTLSAVIAGQARMESWAARFADAADPIAVAVTPLDAGDGPALFVGPPTGDWVLELHVVYANEAGDGAYYWHLVVP